ncbi:MAG: hypothetical protein AB7F96_04370 [Beijerinckiaceae bacterium]
MQNPSLAAEIKDLRARMSGWPSPDDAQWHVDVEAVGEAARFAHAVVNAPDLAIQNMREDTGLTEIFGEIKQAAAHLSNLAEVCAVAARRLEPAD